MIVLNKLAKLCVESAISSDRVTANSHPRAFLYQSFSLLGEVFPKSRLASEELSQWSEYEVAVADVICWLVAFLSRLGCSNIEQLLRDVIAYRERHPRMKPRSSQD